MIGDVAGHLAELRAELRRLGADEATGRLPDDLTVVQVGDLVHRGPESDQVVALVDRYLTEQPAHWVQLVGNHEAQYLREPMFEWPQRIGAEAGQTLLRWWTEGRMQVATWVRADAESFLITHAGLTAEFWRATLGCPSSAEQAAATINSLIGARDHALFRAGTMLNRSWRAGGVGPVWAASGTELLPGWLDTTVPFSQIHGHDSPYDWQRERFRTSDKIARLTVLDHEAKHAVTTLPGGRIIAVDPGHGSQARTPWRAWELGTSSDQAVPGLGGLGIL
ncbi:MAG TPA: metallophosphoesterase [Pseudonocardia sp.]|nr:metallophosphoesterase [Pseudonocardia sp.]